MPEENTLSPAEIEEKLRLSFNLKTEGNTTIPDLTSSISDRITYFCSSKDLIPVICEDMYEYEDPQTHKRQPLRSYMIYEVFSSLGISDIAFTPNELKEIASGSYFGIQLLEEYLNHSVYQELFESVIDIANGKIREHIRLKKEVEEFLQLGNFPLIITTNCFPILEEIVLPQYHYTSSWYSLQTKKTSEEKDAPKTTIKRLPNKCIYHIFGEAQFGRAEWGYNDKQVLKYLKNACSDDYAMSELSAYIADNKTLLFLGNDTPDWLFRFILTPLYGRDVYETGTDYYISEKGDYDEERLNHFLKDIHFEKESKIIEVLTKVNNSLKAKKEATPSYSGHKMQYDFFISHASEDNDLVRKLEKVLRDNGITQIWIDYDKIKDGTYWNHIIDGITHSAYFLPIITDHYIAKTQSKSKQIEALKQINIEELSLDATDARNLNNHLEGVQVELLLANKYLKEHPQDTYSIPIIQKDCEFVDEPLTSKRVENWGKDSRRLPANLFYGIQMHEFDKNNPDSFVMDWKRYKSENELINE